MLLEGKQRANIMWKIIYVIALVSLFYFLSVRISVNYKMIEYLLNADCFIEIK